MTLPQDLTPAVRDWLHEPDELPPPRIAQIGPLVHQTPQQRGRVPRIGLGRFRMFSALKFVTAGVIVALFGGFLLAGVFTTQRGDEVLPAAVSASPTVAAESEATTAPTEPADLGEPVVRSDILSGVELTVEEVEPGVLRVWSDGRRDLADVGVGGVVAGRDGSIWLPPTNADYDFVRLGLPTKKLPKWPRHSQVEGVVVDREGTVWTHETRDNSKDEVIARFRSYENGSWSVRLRAPDAMTRKVLAIAPDDSVWVAYWTEEFGSGLAVARMGPDGWEPLEEPEHPQNARDVFVTEEGEVWLDQQPGRYLALGEDGTWDEVEGGGSLLRHREDDGGWQEVGVDAVLAMPWWSRTEVAPDGMVWFAGVEPLIVDGEPVQHADGWPSPMPGDSFLMRFDGTEWQRWGPRDGVPALTRDFTLRQAPDGGLWMAAGYDDGIPCSEHDGVARFDGSTWQRFLSGHCVGEADVAPDGSVWLRAASGNGDQPRFGLYIITPEADAASE